MSGALALLFTLAATGLLALAAGLMYWVFIGKLDTLANEFVTEEIHDLRHLALTRPGDIRALEAEVITQGDFPAYCTRIWTANGRLVLESPDIWKRIALPAFPGRPATGTEAVSIHKTHGLDGQTYLVAEAWADVGNDRRERWFLQLALDVSTHEALVRELRGILIGMVLLGLGLAAGAGIVLARVGTRPLVRITEAARRVNSAQLRQRIGAPRWPTELTGLANAFDDMLARLEDSFTRLSHFSAGIAHELRTPINNLMGEAEVALAKTRTADEYRAVLESSLEEYQRLEQLIERLLFLARAGDPTSKIAATDLDAATEIHAAFEYYDFMAQEKGVTLHCTGTATVRADPVLFRQAIGNLLANAIQHTPTGGQVTITLANGGDGGTAIRVTDTGPGIAPADLPRIFDGFYRSAAAKTQRPTGSGFGLAIVKSIMQLHGGAASAESQPGHGATFVLHFPPPITET